MKFTTILSALPLLAGVNALPAQKRADNGAFQVMAIRSGSDIHFLPLTASGTSFYLGGKTSSYCPSNVQEQSGCPKGDETVLIGNNGLDTAVPGGQAIYVNPDGALKFTTAHSASMAPGSSQGPFKYSPAQGGSSVGSWTFTGQGASGFMACPTKEGMQVFAARTNATVPGGNVADCVGFEAATNAWKPAANSTSEAAAWQYV